MVGVRVLPGVAPGLATSAASGRVVEYDEPSIAAWSADEAVTALFGAHYRPLVRLAALLLHDTGAAEEITQDAFVALHGHWHRLRDPDRAVAYLRQCVVNRSRSALRHRP